MSNLMARLRDLEIRLSALQRGVPPPGEIDEFSYSPRVREAMAFIERETAAYARKERQAERDQRQASCLHQNITTVGAATMEDPTLTQSWCNECGLNC